MCCTHIQAAARGTTDLVPSSSTQFEVDLIDDGTALLPHIVCAECAQSFALTEGARVSGAVAEQSGALPAVAPTCQVCVDSWRNSVAA
jgi:hypothetical protein